MKIAVIDRGDVDERRQSLILQEIRRHDPERVYLPRGRSVFDPYMGDNWVKRYPIHKALPDCGLVIVTAGLFPPEQEAIEAHNLTVKHM